MRLQMACLYRLVVEIEDYQSDGVAVNWVVGMSGGPKLPVLDFLACLTTVCPKILGASRPTIELLLFSGVFFSLTSPLEPIVVMWHYRLRSVSHQSCFKLYYGYLLGGDDHDDGWIR